MSARVELQAALCAALRTVLDEVPVFDAPPVRMPIAWAMVDEPLLIDWSTKDMAGREARVTVRLHDGGECPVRLREMTARAEAAVTDVERALGAGWRIVTVALLRGRMARERVGWTATSEFRVRMLRES